MSTTTPQNTSVLTLPATITDGDWMLIHCDTFLSDRDRILIKEQAFLMDRDLHGIAPHLPNTKTYPAGTIINP